MKQGRIEHWSKLSECKNLLFFSQLIVELLFDYSIPSNRISTLNSHYLCIDALETIDTIENAGVPEGTLQPIMEELFYSLQKDCVFSLQSEDPFKFFLKYKNDCTYQRVYKVNDLNYYDSKKIVVMLNQKYFSNNWYVNSMTAGIEKLIKDNNPNDWQTLFRITKAWLTELVNMGYDSRYIYDQVNYFFYNDKREIVTPDIISDFLGLFSFAESKYLVVAILDEKYKKLFQAEKDLQWLDAFKTRTPAKIEKSFTSKKQNERFLTSEIVALDPYSAVGRMKAFIALNASMYRMVDHDLDFSIRTVKFASYSATNRFTLVEEEKSAVQRVKMPAKEFQEKMSETLLRAFASTIHQDNYRDLVAFKNALAFHSLSLESISEQNQLLDLWAIFETLLEVSNRHTGDRIQQVCMYLVPILKQKYLFSLFFQLMYDIKAFSEDDYNKIVGEADRKSAVEKIACFTISPEHSAEREAFLQKCETFPLLRERIEYYNTILATPKKVFDFVEKHSKRVSWQIMRIYRNRNLIIHNGDSMPYLKLLVENLHSYIDDFLDYTVHCLSDGHTLQTMSQELFADECYWNEEYGHSKEKEMLDIRVKQMLTQ